MSNWDIYDWVIAAVATVIGLNFAVLIWVAFGIGLREREREWLRSGLREDLGDRARNREIGDRARNREI